MPPGREILRYVDEGAGKVSALLQRTCHAGWLRGMAHDGAESLT